MQSTLNYKKNCEILKNKKAQLKSLTTIKRKEINDLNKKVKTLEKEIYEYMSKRKLETLNGITIQQVTPKITKPKMSKDQRLLKLRQLGIPNPKAALKELGF